MYADPIEIEQFEPLNNNREFRKFIENHSDYMLLVELLHDKIHMSLVTGDNPSINNINRLKINVQNNYKMACTKQLQIINS
jgi:hypothetical protein